MGVVEGHDIRPDHARRDRSERYTEAPVDRTGIYTWMYQNKLGEKGEGGARSPVRTSMPDDAVSQTGQLCTCIQYPKASRAHAGR